MHPLCLFSGQLWVTSSQRELAACSVTLLQPATQMPRRTTPTAVPHLPKHPLHPPPKSPVESMSKLRMGRTQLSARRSSRSLRTFRWTWVLTPPSSRRCGGRCYGSKVVRGRLETHCPWRRGVPLRSPLIATTRRWRRRRGRCCTWPAYDPVSTTSPIALPKARKSRKRKKLKETNKRKQKKKELKKKN